MSEPTATYDPARTTDLDRMRDALGDIDTDAPLAPDVTYLSYLTDADDDWRLAAAAIARRFAAEATRKPKSIQGKPGSIAWGNRPGDWLKIAAFLEAEASRRGGSWSVDPERVDLVETTGEYSVSLRRV